MNERLLALADLPLDELAEAVRPYVKRAGHEYVLATPDYELAHKIKSGVADAVTSTNPSPPAARPSTSSQPVPSSGEGLPAGASHRYLLANNRTRVTPVDWVHLFIDGTWLDNCSGTVIGRNTVVTAAHCIYLDGDWVSYQDSLWPGADGNYYMPNDFWSNQSPHGNGAFDETVMGCWANGQNWQCDLAVLDFTPYSARIGDQTGWVGTNWGVWNSVQWVGIDVDKRGYPWDKPDNEQWKSECGAGSGDSAVSSFSHGCDQVDNDSGGGIFRRSDFAFVGHTTHDSYYWFFGWQYSNHGMKFNQNTKNFVSANSQFP